MELYGLNDDNEEGVSHSRKDVAVLPRKLVHAKDTQNTTDYGVTYLD